MQSILEQLYEDLNSYSETSIPIDRFNSIELKIFPFYPNPPQVKDWMVPLALINITRRVEANWDLTLVKVEPFRIFRRPPSLTLVLIRFANSSMAPTMSVV
jgi:nitrogen permease regulator 2-like protein